MASKYTHKVQKMPLRQIIEFGREEFDGNFDLKITNYTCTLQAGDEKFFFATEFTDSRAFSYYNRMNKEVGGEIREITSNPKYFDFSGILNLQHEIEEAYCVDINSAYLTALKNEKVITETTFNWINIESKKSEKAKLSRLRSVGMFAKNPVIMHFNNGSCTDIDTSKRNPFAWVFFLSCLKTQEAMEAVKKLAGEDFLFYWVDGIFIKKKNPKILETLKNLGFESKEETVFNLRKTERNIFYRKSKTSVKEKILFLPSAYTQEEKREVRAYYSTVNKL